MTKEKLIELISILPSGMEVVIFDHRQNTHFADSDPSSIGLHADFRVGIIDPNEGLGEHEKDHSAKAFAVLEFDNDEYDINGDHIEL